MTLTKEQMEWEKKQFQKKFKVRMLPVLNWKKNETGGLTFYKVDEAFSPLSSEYFVWKGWLARAELNQTDCPCCGLDHTKPPLSDEEYKKKVLEWALRDLEKLKAMTKVKKGAKK